MIDRTRIAFWLALFADRIGRDIAEPTIAAYMTAITSYRLSPDEFEFSAETLFERERFLPPPIEFLYTARPEQRPGAQARAARALLRNAVVNVGQPGIASIRRIDWTRIPETLRETARAAFDRAGGSADQIADGADFGFSTRFDHAFQEVHDEQRVARVRALPSPRPMLPRGA